jgi:hypothetical protein
VGTAPSLGYAVSGAICGAASGYVVEVVAKAGYDSASELVFGLDVIRDGLERLEARPDHEPCDELRLSSRAGRSASR